jgi:glutathione S-transferase
MRSSGETRRAAVDSALASLATLDEALGKASSSSKTFFFGGEEMGFVDLMFAPLVCWYRAFEAVGEFEFKFHETYPHLDAWLAAFNRSHVAPLLPNPEKVKESFIHHRSSSRARNPKP